MRRGGTWQVQAGRGGTRHGMVGQRRSWRGPAGRDEARIFVFGEGESFGDLGGSKWRF